MMVVLSNNIKIANPNKELLKWCKDNLILPNPEYAKKARMGFWTGNTPETLCLFETVDDFLVLPAGTYSNVRQFMNNKDFVVHEFKPLRHVNYEADIPLYDYQEKAVQAMSEAHGGILQSAAGSGKTQMGLALATKIGGRTLWLCHTLDLVKQSKDRAKQYMDSSLIGEISGGKVNISSGITFATVQTMSKLDLIRYKDCWDCIIVDEVHRVSGSPTSVTQYQKVLNNLSAPYKYGLSATVHRSDGLIQATFALIGDIAYSVPDEAIADKIMKVGVRPVGTGVRITEECLNPDGTINYTQLITYLTKEKERNLLIANLIEVGKPSLILSDRLEHLSVLKDLLPYHELDKAVMISGKMSTKKGRAERDEAIEDMRSGKKKYLFATYSLAKEGLDIPCLERLYLATPQKDYAIITQAIGRIARVCEGKEDPVCYDFVDDIGYLVKSYKKRCSTYRKNGCYFVEEGETD